MNADKSDCIPRVLHLVISLDYGGLERLVVDWVNARNAKWPESTFICCLDKPGDLAKQVEGDAVICFNANRTKFPWDRQAVDKLLSVACHGVAVSETGSINAGSIDAIHSHNLAAQQYAVLASRKAGVKHVYSQHGANVHNLGFKDRLRSRILCSLTDKVVAVSESVKESMVEAQGIPSAGIDVVRNGVNVGKVSGLPSRRHGLGELRAELGIGEDCFVFGSVGRLEHVKGYDRIISAFAEMSKEQRGKSEDRHDYQLLLIGDGSERNRLEAQARELGVGDRVIFAGFQEDVGKYYSVMDLFVLPSRSEGLPIALLEAMAAGVPVAVTDVGECREIIEDGKLGLLLPEDEGRWPSVISEWLIVNSEEKAAMIKRAVTRVEESYSLDKTLEEYEDLYK